MAVLLVKKNKLLSLDRSNKRIVFEFERTPYLDTCVQELRLGESRIEPSELWAAIRRCKQLLYEGE